MQLDRGLGIVHRVRRRLQPHVFYVVIVPDLGAEQVHHDIAGIDDDPVALVGSFQPDIAIPLFFQAFLKFFGKSGDLCGGTAGGDDHVIGDTGLAAQVDGFDVFRLVSIQRFFNKGFQLFRGAEPVLVCFQNGCFLLLWLLADNA